MADPTATPGNRIGSAIAYVCAHLADVRAQLTYLGDTTALDELLARVRGGDDPTAALDHLHNTLLTGGDVLGVFGSTGRSWNVRPVGVGASAPAEAIYVCPFRRCSRYTWAEPGNAATPSCEIDAAPMHWERLS